MNLLNNDSGLSLSTAAMTSTAKYAFFPIEDPDLHDFYSKLTSTFWIAPEVPLTKENREEFDALDENTRRFLVFILAFFAQADGIINENLFERFLHELGFIKAARNFYSVQAANETVHNEVYSLLIDTFIRDPEEKAKALDAISCDEYKSIAALAQWTKEWSESDRPLMERLIAIACVEGVFFSSAFAAVYWIKKRNILNGLTTANAWIARDEAIHTEWAGALYRNLTTKGVYDKVHPDRITEIVKSAMDVAELFVRDALKVELIGMNADEMVTYVKNTADSLLKMFGAPQHYGCDCPYPWMLNIGLPNKSNFHEHTVTEYTKGSADNTFDLSTPF